jgi:transcriptional regulator with XRE-family HTH domain
MQLLRVVFAAYMANETAGTLGDRIRDARIAHRRGLRELARELEMTPSYLSDIENDRRIPAEPVLRTLATKLEIDFDVLMALGGRLGEQTQRYVRHSPEAARLFRRISEQQLDDHGLQRLGSLLDSLARKG